MIVYSLQHLGTGAGWGTNVERLMLIIRISGPLGQLQMVVVVVVRQTQALG